MPASESTKSPAMRTGFSAATRSLAASITEAESPVRRPVQGELRYVQCGVFRNRIFHQGAVEHDDDGLSRRRHGDLVRADGGLREMRQRDGEVIPLGEVTDHGGRVLGAVKPLDAGTPLVGVDGIANHDDDRRPAGPGIVDAHGGML